MDCLIWYIDVYIQVNVCIVNYIYKQIHIANNFRKFCTALKKRILLLMKILTKGPFRYAGTHILSSKS